MNNIRIIVAVVLTLALFALSGCNSDSVGSDSVADDTDTSGTASETMETKDTGSNTDEGTSGETETETDTITETETQTESETETVTETETETEPDVEDVITDENKLVYVALGDSIAYGYALKDVEGQRYSTLIDSHLDTLWENGCEVYNYAVSGDKGGDLIDILKKGNAPAISSAHVITISIGANNVLGPALDNLSEYFVFLTVPDENLRKTELPRIYGELMAETKSGIEDFSREIVTIIEEIRKSAPDAEIIFQTVYNPYRLANVKLDFIDGVLDLAEETDRLVSALNKIIVDNASLGYTVADIYTAYDGLTDVVNADLFIGDGTDIDQFILAADPHPNEKGHRVIADTIIPLITLP